MDLVSNPRYIIFVIMENVCFKKGTHFAGAYLIEMYVGQYNTTSFSHYI